MRREGPCEQHLRVFVSPREAPAPEITMWGRGKHCRAPRWSRGSSTAGCRLVGHRGSWSLPEPGMLLGLVLVPWFWQGSGTHPRPPAPVGIHDAAPQAGLPGFPKACCDAECNSFAETKSSLPSPRSGCVLWQQRDPGCSPGDKPTDRLKTGGKMAANRPPWSPLAQHTPRPGCHRQLQQVGAAKDSPGQHQAPIRANT